jgi:hypothetical protein
VINEEFRAELIREPSGPLRDGTDRSGGVSAEPNEVAEGYVQ